MKRLGLFMVVAVLAAAQAGCFAYAQAPVTGALYSVVQGPLQATSNSGATLEGRATCQTILGLVAQGDCSISAAAEDGGITTIHHVDHETTNILGIIATFTTIVYGT